MSERIDDHIALCPYCGLPEDANGHDPELPFTETIWTCNHCGESYTEPNYMTEDEYYEGQANVNERGSAEG